MKRAVLLICSTGVPITYFIGCFQTTDRVSQYIASFTNLFLSQTVAHTFMIWRLKYMKFFFQILADPPKNMETTFGTKSCKFPIGIAAGMDPNAECFHSLSRLKFGFVEIGTVTPHPQNGFRFTFWRSNKTYTFPYHQNKGYDHVLKKLTKYRNQNQHLILGVNLAPDCNSDDPVKDHIKGVELFAEYVDYFSINFTNSTKNQFPCINSAESLKIMLKEIHHVLGGTINKAGLFLKIQTFFSDSEYEKILHFITENKTIITGIIIDDSASCERKDKSVEHLSKIIRYFYENTKGETVIIGSGRVISGEQAFEIVSNGASFVQVESSVLLEDGMAAGVRINRELNDIFKQKELKNAEEARGWRIKK